MHGHKLFHAIVVAGTAFGCGGIAVIDGGGSAGAGGGAGNAGNGGSGNAGNTGGIGGTAGSGGISTGGGGALGCPGGPTCAHPAEKECLFEGCGCDPSAPHAPEECVTTADFHCQCYDPGYTACECIPGSPQSDADCENFGFFSCWSYMPLIGCYCVVPIA